MEEHHQKYMSHCRELAKIAQSEGNSPVGAILVFQDGIIGEGIESGKSTGNITNHAEILAILDAISKGHQALLNQSILYTTHEPCIMCSYPIRHYKIPHIVYGADVEHVGGFSSRFAILQAEDVPQWGKKPEVTVYPSNS